MKHMPALAAACLCAAAALSLSTPAQAVDESKYDISRGVYKKPCLERQVRTPSGVCQNIPAFVRRKKVGAFARHGCPPGLYKGGDGKCHEDRIH